MTRIQRLTKVGAAWVALVLVGSVVIWSLAGCGGGGGSGSSSAFVPPAPTGSGGDVMPPSGGGSTGGGEPSASKGTVVVQVTFDGQQYSRRAIPEVHSVYVDVMGEGQPDEYFHGYVTPESPTPSPMFTEVPPGQKVVVAQAFGSGLLALNGKLATVEAGKTTTVTINLSLSERPGIFTTTWSGTATIGGRVVPVLKFSTGAEEYYGPDKEPPYSGPISLLLYGSRAPQVSTPATWAPPLVWLSPSPPLGRTNTQTVTRTFPDGSTESQTVTETFMGLEAVVPGEGSRESVAAVNTARDPRGAGIARRSLAQRKGGRKALANLRSRSSARSGRQRAQFGGGDPCKFVMTVRGARESYDVMYWVREGVGRVMQLTLDTSGNIQDIWLLNQAAGTWGFPNTLEGTCEYTSSKSVPGGDVTVTVGFPFGINEAIATENPDNAVILTFSKPLDPTTATTIANYALESPQGTPVSLSGGKAVVFNQRQVLLQGPSLTKGKTFKVTVANIKSDKGDVIAADGLMNTAGGDVGADEFSPLLLAASADSYTLRLDFSEPIKQPTSNISSYVSLYSPLGQSVSLWSATSRLDAATGGRSLFVDLPRSNCPAPLRDKFHVEVDSFQDVAGNSMPSWGNPAIEGNVTDVAPPCVKSASATTAQLTVTFWETLNPADAVSRSNYELESPHGKRIDLSAAVLTYDATAMTVTITNVTLASDFKLRVSGIADVAGNRMDWQVLEGSVTTAPPPLSVSASSDRIWVTFANWVDSTDAANPLNYWVESPVGTRVAIGTVMYDSSTYTAVIRGVTLVAGAQVKVTVRNVGGLTQDGIQNVGTAVVDNTLLRILSVTRVNNVTAQVLFSGDVMASDAQNWWSNLWIFDPQTGSMFSPSPTTQTYAAATFTVTFLFSAGTTLPTDIGAKARNVRKSDGSAGIKFDWALSSAKYSRAKAPQSPSTTDRKSRARGRVRNASATIWHWLSGLVNT